MKKIGLGVQEFSEFKKNNLIYVDKTEIIHQLIEEGKYYFLSRPRRFGKSLLLNTIKELFTGHRDYFTDCWIDPHWDWETSFPVLKLSFAEVPYQTEGLEKALNWYLSQQAKEHGITLESTTYATQLGELIQKLGAQKPVVLLIDEYDKPIVDYLEEPERKQAHEHRKILKAFYTGVKDLDRYIRFLFITGVSKFSKVSIFNDLNHLLDISLGRTYSQIVGYTEEQILHYYYDYLETIAQQHEISLTSLVEQMRSWYNGYSWDGKQFLYNPFSVLGFLRMGQFHNYWWETGSPTFLIDEIKNTGRFIDEAINRHVDMTLFNKFDIDRLDITGTLFQTGYLTIKANDPLTNTILLDFPNKEVHDSFLLFSVDYYANSPTNQMNDIVSELVEALREQDLTQFTDTLKALFSAITVKQLDKVKEYGGFYHSLIFIVLKLLGIHIQCEVQSRFGASDAVIQTDDTIYVFEFKMDSAQKALNQIKKKQYHAPYLTDKRKLILAGFSFDKAQRNLADFVEETIQN